MRNHTLQGQEENKQINAGNPEPNKPKKTHPWKLAQWRSTYKKRRETE